MIRRGPISVHARLGVGFNHARLDYGLGNTPQDRQSPSEKQENHNRRISTIGPYARPPADTRSHDRRPEDRRPEDRRPGDRRPEDRRPEDRRPEDRRPEDRHPEDRHPEDRRQAIAFVCPFVGNPRRHLVEIINRVRWNGKLMAIQFVGETIDLLINELSFCTKTANCLTACKNGAKCPHGAYCFHYHETRPDSCIDVSDQALLVKINTTSTFASLNGKSFAVLVYLIECLKSLLFPPASMSAMALPVSMVPSLVSNEVVADSPMGCRTVTPSNFPE